MIELLPQIQVLTHDSRNVKAFYRRGQAHKELGNLKVGYELLISA